MNWGHLVSRASFYSSFGPVEEAVGRRAVFYVKQWIALCLLTRGRNFRTGHGGCGGPPLNGRLFWCFTTLMLINSRNCWVASQKFGL